MEGQQYSTAVEAEELRASSLSDQNSEKLSQAEIERLGRQRPAIFSTNLVEFGFVICIVLSLMMSEYFTSGFNIILPSLAPAIGLPKAARTWPAAVPNLAAAAFLLPFARLCAQLGARQIFLYGHLWLLVWSGLNGFASNYILIILCRAMQGIGFAAFLPAGLALLGQIYRPGPRKNLVYCIYGAFACVGFYFGIFVAALTAEFVNWRWYFYIGSILQLALLGLGFMVVPRNLNDSSDDARMDWWGLATIVPGIALVSYVLTDANHAPQGWKTPYVYICLVAGFLFLGAAVYVQKKVSTQPLVPVHVLRIKYMLRLSVGLFCYFGLFSIFMFYSSLYIQDLLDVTPLLTAAWYAPLVVGGIMLAIGGGLLLHIISSQILMVISSVGFFLCVLLFALAPAQAEGESTTYIYWAFIFPAMCFGTIGVDLMFNVTNVFITTSVPKRDQAAVGGLTNSLIYLGSSFWLGVSELVVSTTQSARGQTMSLLEQFRIAFWLGVALGGVAVLITLTMRLGRAEADLTADEKEALQKREKAQGN